MANGPSSTTTAPPASSGAKNVQQPAIASPPEVSKSGNTSNQKGSAQIEFSRVFDQYTGKPLDSNTIIVPAPLIQMQAPPRPNSLPESTQGDQEPQSATPKGGVQPLALPILFEQEEKDHAPLGYLTPIVEGDETQGFQIHDSHNMGYIVPYNNSWSSGVILNSGTELSADEGRANALDLYKHFIPFDPFPYLNVKFGGLEFKIPDEPRHVGEEEIVVQPPVIPPVVPPVVPPVEPPVEPPVVPPVVPPVIPPVIPPVVNSAPSDGNEVYTFNEDDLVGKTINITPTKLANATDPNGDPVHIDVFGSSSVNLSSKFSIDQTGIGVYTLTYLANPSDHATITILSDGTETFTDSGAINHLALGEQLNITINYIIADINGAQAPQSHQVIQIIGKNDAPVDGNEIYIFNEEDLNARFDGNSEMFVARVTFVTPNKLANASDPDGDPVHIEIFGDASIDLTSKFIIEHTSTNVYTLTYKLVPSEQAFITIQPNGTETITDLGALHNIAFGEELNITIKYSIADNHGVLAAESQQVIKIIGVNHPPRDLDEQYFFSEKDLRATFNEQGQLISKTTTFATTKLETAFDDDGDDVHISDFGASSVNLSSKFSIVQTSTGLYTLTYNANPADKAIIQINPTTGEETFTDMGAVRHIAFGERLEITMKYTVADEHGAKAPESQEVIFITGENEPPTDINEFVQLNERDLVSPFIDEDEPVSRTTTIPINKLANAVDPDGDPIQFESFGAASVNLTSMYSITPTGVGEYTLTFLGDSIFPLDQAIIRIQPNGTETLEDIGALHHLAPGQILDITIKYTVSDIFHTPAPESQQTIRIIGQNNPPVDIGERLSDNILSTCVSENTGLDAPFDLVPTLLNNTFDFEHDTLHVTNLQNARFLFSLDDDLTTLSAEEASFFGALHPLSIAISGNVIKVTDQITSKVATFTVDLSNTLFDSNHLDHPYGAGGKVSIYDPDNIFNGMKDFDLLDLAFDYQVVDAFGVSTPPSTATIGICGENDCPIVTMDCIDEDILPSNTDRLCDLLVQDPEGDDIIQAIITLSGNLEDRLVFQGNIPGLTATLSDDGHTLTLTSLAGLSDDIYSDILDVYLLNPVLTQNGIFLDLAKNSDGNVIGGDRHISFLVLDDPNHLCGFVEDDLHVVEGPPPNHRPTDGPEIYFFFEDEVANKVITVTDFFSGNKLNNAQDPDGDATHIGVFGSASVSLSNFSIEQTSTPGVYILSYVPDPEDFATITVFADGTETMSDMGAFEHLEPGDLLGITIHYTVADSHNLLALDESRQDIFVVGVEECDEFTLPPGIVLNHGDPGAEAIMDSLNPLLFNNYYNATSTVPTDGDDFIQTADLNTRFETDALAGNDTIISSNKVDTLFGSDGNDIIYGIDKNDEIHGNAGADVIFGGGKNDVIYGDELPTDHGDDILLGEGGNDEIFGGNCDDFISGGEANDILNGEDGDDTIFGGTQNDIIDGGAGNDFLFGGNDNDEINGGSGQDFILGGEGNDVLNGGNDQDTFEFDLSDNFGHDRIEDLNHNGVTDIISFINVADVTGDNMITIADLDANGDYSADQSGNHTILRFGSGSNGAEIIIENFAPSNVIHTFAELATHVQVIVA